MSDDELWAVVGHNRYDARPNPMVACLCRDRGQARLRIDELNARGRGRRYKVQKVKVEGEA